MEAARPRVSGHHAADPTISLQILQERARYIIRVWREGDGFRAEAEYPRHGARLSVIAVLHQAASRELRVAGEIGLGRTRPYGRARTNERGVIAPHRSRAQVALPTQAWEAVLPPIIECLRDAVARRVEERYKVKGVFRRRQLVLRFDRNGDAVPVRTDDDREAAFAAAPWRGTRVSVDMGDPVLVGIFNTLDQCHPAFNRRLFAYASVLHTLMQPYRWQLNGAVPREVREFLMRPGQIYFYRPAALLELLQVQTRKPRFEEVVHERMRRRRKKGGGYSTSVERRVHLRRRYGPLLEHPDAVLELLVRAACITHEVAAETQRLRQTLAGRRNILAPFGNSDRGPFARDIEVRYAAEPLGPRYPGPRRMHWKPPSYVIYEARLAPYNYEAVLRDRAAEREFFADVDSIIFER
ncbi:hypothetical protein HYW67_03435 [Candidatus Parcubacteria bacterium]|nr:hypothetical protein [Candidatus Parcubacteria bacterium]